MTMRTRTQAVHYLTTWRSARSLENQDTSQKPLVFRIDPIEAEKDAYDIEDSVILTSSDGATFIAHLVEVEADLLRIYVELD